MRPNMHELRTAYHSKNEGSQTELIQIVRENEQLKIKNKQLKDLAKKLKSKNRDRKNHIKELNEGLEHALNVNTELEIQINKLLKEKKSYEKYIKSLEGKVRGFEKSKRELSRGRKRKVEKKEETKVIETLGSREEAQVNKLIKIANKIGILTKEDLKKEEMNSFIFHLRKNPKTKYLESQLLNKTVYTQKMKNNILSTLLDKIFRSDILEDFENRIFFSETNYLFLPKQMIDVIFDSDFSEYLENPEDDEEMDDYDQSGINMKFPISNQEILNKKKKSSGLFHSEEVTPKKDSRKMSKKRLPSLQERSKRSQSNSRSNYQTNIKSQKGNQKANTLYNMLRPAKQWPMSKYKIETGRRNSKSRKEKYFSQMNIQKYDDDSQKNIYKSNLYERKRSRDKESKYSDQQRIFKNSDSKSSFSRLFNLKVGN
jgi:hypothetical protein